VAKITIDGKEWDFAEGMNLFEACTIARGGEKLPHFCYHPGLPIAGVCRMCQVEVEGVPKLQIACNSTVREGMVVRTRSERVESTVRQILGFHLLHHPVDCPICDQVGECALQDQYMAYGLYEADEDVEDKLAKRKVQPLGPLVVLDAERCVLCARCTRFTEHVTKTHELGIFQRGNHSEVGLAPGTVLDNNYTLNTVDICPVGALTSRDFRFRKRVYWLSRTDGVCPGCATGCNMVLSHAEGTLYRYQPRENRAVNGWWMCDHGRLLYKDVHAENRLEEPLVREEGSLRPAGWDHAYNTFVSRCEALGEERRLVLVGSPHSSLEELYALRSLLEERCGGTVLGHRLLGSEMEEDDGLLLRADRTPNDRGARLLGLEDLTPASLEEAAGKEACLLILANDLAAIDPTVAPLLERFGLVVFIGAWRGATAERADLVLPGRTYAEKEGTFVNLQGRAQRFHAAVAGPRQSREDWRILAEVGELLGHAATWRAHHDLLSELSVRHEAFAALAGGVPSEGTLLADAPRAEEVERG
jgi:NADH-quinone oxidoreductase subunit G